MVILAHRFPEKECKKNRQALGRFWPLGSAYFNMVLSLCLPFRYCIRQDIQYKRLNAFPSVCRRLADLCAGFLVWSYHYIVLPSLVLSNSFLLRL